MSCTLSPQLLAFLLVILLAGGCSEPPEPTISLYRALHSGNLDQVKRNIHWGADVNQPGPDGERPLHVVAIAGRYILVRLLLEHGAEVDAPDAKGHSPLYVALMARRVRVAQELLAAGARLDASSMLREAVLNQVGDRDVFALLLAQGADIDQPDANGDTPLHLAVRKGYRLVVKQLVARGADVNAVNQAGATPLSLALAGDSAEIVDLLRRNGAVEAP